MRFATFCIAKTYMLNPSKDTQKFHKWKRQWSVSRTPELIILAYVAVILSLFIFLTFVVH